MKRKIRLWKADHHLIKAGLRLTPENPKEFDLIWKIDELRKELLVLRNE